MTPPKLVETKPGSFSLIFEPDVVPPKVAELIEELGHIPNGYFWDGVAKTIVRLRAPDLEGTFRLDSEAGMFCAYGGDRDALTRLGDLIAPTRSDENALREILDEADPNEFDD